MAKSKTIECTLIRWQDIGRFDFYIRDTFAIGFCLKKFKSAAPALCKGLRPGQSRKLILTQTARGIKLERAEK